MRSEQLTDKCLTSNSWILKKVLNENSNQLSKWGIQTHSAFEWVAYTTEELGELAQAISEYEYRDGQKKDIVKEAVQLATLALKIAEMYDDSAWPDPMGDEESYGG